MPRVHIKLWIHIALSYKEYKQRGTGTGLALGSKLKSHYIYAQEISMQACYFAL